MVTKETDLGNGVSCTSVPRPSGVYWEAQARRSDSDWVKNAADEILGTEEAKLLIDQVHRFGRPQPLFVFAGSPFTRRDLLELIEYANEKHLPTVVAAEAIDFTEENLRAIKKAGAKEISVFLEATPELEQDNKRYQALFFLTLRAVQLARMMGLKIRLMTTVTPAIASYLPQIFKLACRMAVNTWSLVFPFTKTLQAEMTSEEFQAVLHFVYDASKYINVEISEPRHYNRIHAQRIILEQKGLSVEVLKLAPLYDVLKTAFKKIVSEEDLIPRSRLRYPLTHDATAVYVSKTGEVYPDGFLYRNAGNIRHRSLVEIYHNSWIFVSLRNLSKEEGRCAFCEFAAICGVSQARAYMLTGDPLAEEPFCSHIPGSFGFRNEIQAIAESQAKPH